MKVCLSVTILTIQGGLCCSLPCGIRSGTTDMVQSNFIWQALSKIDAEKNVAG